MSLHSEPRKRALALERGPDGAYEAYNEAAFRHFLHIENGRAERSGRVVLLVLVELEAGGNPAPIPAAGASKLFAALTGCVREVDFVGWYRTGRTAAAVLMQGTGSVSGETSTAVGVRVGDILRARLPASIGSRIQVRVVQQRSSTET